MVLSLSGCAAACEMQMKPRCAGFQYFQIMDGEMQRPLCFLLQKLEAVRTYECKVLEEGSLLQAKNSTAGRSLRGPSESARGMDICTKVGIVRKFSALSCESIFGKESEYIKKCSKECEPADGNQFTAVCMAAILQGKPAVETKTGHKCFGGDKKTDQSAADFRIQEFGVDAS